MWRDRVPAEADYCCYWFEKARAALQAGRCKRVGLLGTQAIRGGANRVALQRIKESGGIFFGVSDREWVLEGATVRVSMVGFDNGDEAEHVLDGETVGHINADLTSHADVTSARPIPAQSGQSFMADTKGGPFEVPAEVAFEWLHSPNPHGLPNSDVLRPWVNGRDVAKRNRGLWIVDFPPGTARAQAELYELVFAQIETHVYPMRRDNKRAAYAKRWWIHMEPRPEMRAAFRGRPRYLATNTVAKHRFFLWLPGEVLPDHQLIVFNAADDYTFGVLHSRIHEVWATATGTQLREEESGRRYTPTSTFETFPFPVPTAQQRELISTLSADLVRLRSRWLDPPEWVRESKVTFPATVNGPWGLLVRDATPNGIGVATYTSLIPVDEDAEKALKKRTLTTLYNSQPAWLREAHRALDEAVFASYGWQTDLTDEQILAKLLEQNLANTAGQR